MNIDEAMSQVTKIGEYNSFTPEYVNEILEDNRNEIEDVLEVSCHGVEGVTPSNTSPIIVVKMKESAPTNYTHNFYTSFVNDADEVDYIDEEKRTIRLWWD